MSVAMSLQSATLLFRHSHENNHYRWGLVFTGMTGFIKISATSGSLGIYGIDYVLPMLSVIWQVIAVIFLTGIILNM